jgi:hypothetical protein
MDLSKKMKEMSGAVTRRTATANAGFNPSIEQVK